MEPSEEATTLVWKVPSNLSSALNEKQMIWSVVVLTDVMEDRFGNQSEM